MEQNTKNNIVNMMATKNQDMKGRRSVGAGDAVDPQDYVTLNQLNNFSFITPYPAQSHMFLNSVTDKGVFTAKRPSFSDISGVISVTQLPPSVFNPDNFDIFIQAGSSDGRRTIGGIYQNLKGQMLFVFVTIVFPGSGSVPMQCTARTGGDSSMPFILSRPGINAAQPTTVEIPLTLLIPNQWYYQVYVTAGSGITMDCWYECW